jgi:hypothetical protein
MSRSHQNSNLIWIQIGLEFRKDLKIKKPFPVFYWPWAEFNPAGPAWPPNPLSRAALIMTEQHQRAARTGPTDTLRSHHNDEAEYEFKLETLPGKISPISNIHWKRPRILTENRWGLCPHLSRALGWKPL